MKPLGLPPLHDYWSDHSRFWLLAWSLQCSDNSIPPPLPTPSKQYSHREYWKYKNLFSDMGMKQLSLTHPFLSNAPGPAAHQKWTDCRAGLSTQSLLDRSADFWDKAHPGRKGANCKADLQWQNSLGREKQHWAVKNQGLILIGEAATEFGLNSRFGLTTLEKTL